MNIQGANLLSLLSGPENLGTLQQGFSGLSGDQAGFASALMQQLGLLNDSLASNTGSSDLTTLQSWVKEGGEELRQNLQNFAVNLGQNLPAANQNSDIDLEDTLQTLSDVLQQLQQLDIDAQDITLPPVTESIADAESATGAETLAGTQPGQNAETKPVEAQTLPSPAEQAIEAAAAMANNPAPMPVTLPQADIQAAADSTGLSELLPETQKPAPATSQETRTQSNATGINPDDAGLEFDRGISAALARNDTDNNSKPQPEKSPQTLKTENSAGQLADVATNMESSKIDGHKPVQDIAGDISRMHQVVRNETTVSAPATQPAMSKQLTDPAWRQELGNKLLWMHNQSIPSVELRLNPEHLGPVLIKIDVSQEQASVAFTTQHLAVKDAIEAAIPKLREMLGGQQLNLVDVNVSQQQSDQRQPAREFFQMASEQGQRRQADAETAAKGPLNEAQHIVDEIEAGRAIASNGLLSLYA